jgi:hypothetical protein
LVKAAKCPVRPYRELVRPEGRRGMNEKIKERGPEKNRNG